MVVVLALASPIAFKIYMNFLIGQSLKRAVYPDIIIFGALFLFFVLLRGLVLSVYFRHASLGLFARLITAQRQLCGDQLLSVAKERDDRIENDFARIDSNLVVCF